MTHLEYLALIGEVTEYDKRYAEAKPIISDYEYDLKMAQLVAYEKAHPDKMAAHSPTQRLWETATEGFQQRPHLVPMFSLANTYSSDEVSDFCKTGAKAARKTRDCVFCCETQNGWHGHFASLRKRQANPRPHEREWESGRRCDGEYPDD